MSDAKVFIGAPTEDGGLAVALQGLLEKCSSVRVWHQGDFEANRGTLESLLIAIDAYDFACFLAPPVDIVESRNTTHEATRDNIIFEYGLFLGRLGPDRVFLIYPRDTDLTLPSDLKGVNHLSYKPVDADNPASAVLGPPAQKVEEHIKELGSKQPIIHRRYSPVLERGSVDRVAGLSDAALYYSRRRYGYKDDI
ncbi:MAG: TIR domain-containing protein [Solirubrobacteraceae bacterium]